MHKQRQAPTEAKVLSAPEGAQVKVHQMIIEEMCACNAWMGSRAELLEQTP